jgi:AraC-like DNA-binding protein
VFFLDLGKTAQPVTAIMYDGGFQTKSNLNREFLRVTGTKPRDWRQESAMVTK